MYLPGVASCWARTGADAEAVTLHGAGEVWCAGIACEQVKM